MSLQQPLSDFQRAFRAAMDVPMLNADAELKAARAWRDHKDAGAMERIILSHQRMAYSAAAGYKGYGLSLMDLAQEGMLGLMQAAQKFDPEKGYRFSTYAGWWVRAAMQEHILRNTSLVKIGTTAAQKKLFFNLRRMAAEIGATGDHLTEEQAAKIAKELEVTSEDVRVMEARLHTDASLDAPWRTDGGAQDSTWMETIEDGRNDPEEALTADRAIVDQRHYVAAALKDPSLSEREKTIIRERKMKPDGEEATLEQLGVLFGISKERVRQIEVEALQKLRVIILRMINSPSDLMSGDISLVRSNKRCPVAAPAA